MVYCCTQASREEQACYQDFANVGPRRDVSESQNHDRCRVTKNRSHMKLFTGVETVIYGWPLPGTRTDVARIYTKLHLMDSRVACPAAWVALSRPVVPRRPGHSGAPTWSSISRHEILLRPRHALVAPAGTRKVTTWYFSRSLRSRGGP